MPQAVLADCRQQSAWRSTVRTGFTFSTAPPVKSNDSILAFNCSPPCLALVAVETIHGSSSIHAGCPFQNATISSWPTPEIAGWWNSNCDQDPPSRDTFDSCARLCVGKLSGASRASTPANPTTCSAFFNSTTSLLAVTSANPVSISLRIRVCLEAYRKATTPSAPSGAAVSRSPAVAPASFVPAT